MSHAVSKNKNYILILSGKKFYEVYKDNADDNKKIM